MSIANDIVDAVMNNDAVAIQQFIAQNQIQAHDCLALRTAVYCNNSSITQLVVAHSDIFAWNANAVYLSIENDLGGIFDILFPYICAKNDVQQNFEFLLKAVALNRPDHVEKLVSFCDLKNQSITGIISPLHEVPQPRIIQDLLDNMSSSQHLFLAKKFTLSGDEKRLKSILEHLNFKVIQALHDVIQPFNRNTNLSKKGEHCLDLINQHRQKFVLLHTVSNTGVSSKRKL